MSALSRIVHLGLIGLALTASQLAAEEVRSSVATPTKRNETLQNAKALLAIQTVAMPADLGNPFNPPDFAGAAKAAGGATGTTAAAAAAAAESPAAKPAGPRTDRDIIQAIAANLKPSGYFVLGGEATLVFGQKRVKAGGHLTITFEGSEYTLEVTAIDRPNFTLRLNREEFTRPIK